jgi:uncharacterized protein with PIN domain
MGLNLDVANMIGITSAQSRCPKCNESLLFSLQDYDIEAGEVNPSPGLWEFDLYCHKCELEVRLTVQVAIVTTKFA